MSWANRAYRRKLVRALGEDAGRAMDELAALHSDLLMTGAEKSAEMLRREAVLFDRMGCASVTAQLIRSAREADPDWRWDAEHEPGPGRWYRSPADDGWPGSQDVDPDTAADTLYLKLHGAREALCVAQMLLDEDRTGRALLGMAVARIDAVGSTLPQWSSRHRDHEL